VKYHFSIDISGTYNAYSHSTDNLIILLKLWSTCSHLVRQWEERRTSRVRLYLAAEEVAFRFLKIWMLFGKIIKENLQ